MNMILSCFECLDCISNLDDYYTMNNKLNDKNTFQKIKHQTSYFKSKDTYIQPKPIIKNNNQTYELDDDVGLILILKK